MGRFSVAPNKVLLDKYRIESVLGRGGMGVVVRARHLGLGELVAIKVMSEDAGISNESFARFMREAQAAARLRTEHVVRVSDVGMLPEGMPYMVMELLDGRDLGQVVKEGGAIGPRFAAEVGMQAAEVLAEAHAMGIIHRDIKPSNIFITPDPDGLPFVKVLDFGVAKATDVSAAPITRTQSMLGTPAYMSPEQLRSSKGVDHRTDIWSLGVMLYEVLEGHRPFESDVLPDLIMKIALDPPQRMQKTAPDLEAIVMRCIDKNPDKRFQSASDLAEALAPYAGDKDRARTQLDRIRSVVRSSIERLGDPAARGDATPIPRGRLDATADVRQPTPEPVPLPTAPTAPVGSSPFSNAPTAPQMPIDPTAPTAMSVPTAPMRPSAPGGAAAVHAAVTARERPLATPAGGTPQVHAVTARERPPGRTPAAGTPLHAMTPVGSEISLASTTPHGRPVDTAEVAPIAVPVSTTQRPAGTRSPWVIIASALVAIAVAAGIVVARSRSDSEGGAPPSQAPPTPVAVVPDAGAGDATTQIATSTPDAAVADAAEEVAATPGSASEPAGSAAEPLKTGSGSTKHHPRRDPKTTQKKDGAGSGSATEPCDGFNRRGGC